MTRQLNYFDAYYELYINIVVHLCISVLNTIYLNHYSIIPNNQKHKIQINIKLNNMINELF